MKHTNLNEMQSYKSNQDYNQAMDRRKVCRYFERGSCKKQKCPFVHLSENRKNCQFFMKGFCKKGTNCRFYHPPKQAQQNRQIKKHFKPAFEKKEQKVIEHHQEEEQEEHIQDEDAKQQKVEKKHELDADREAQRQNIKEENFKKHQINLILGLGSDSSDQQQMNQAPSKQAARQNKRILNFNKIYPKKFPDYSKNPDFKERILNNQQKFFKGQKFLDFINKINDPAEKQYYQIIRKFQDSFTLQDQQNPRIFQINMRPILYENEVKLHFEMVQDTLELRIDCTRYPEERARIAILNQSIPQEYKEKLNEFINQTHEKKTIFDTLKLLLNNFEKVYARCKEKLENQYFSQLELESRLQKKLSAENQARQQFRKQRKVKKIKNNEQIEVNPYVEVIKVAATDNLIVGNMNYAIMIGSLMQTNCEYVVAARVLLFLACQCEQEIIHILECDQKRMKIREKLRCKKCNIVILLCLDREVMQIRSEKVGQLGIQNGRLIEVGGIGWKVGCSCDNEISKSKVYMPGERMKVNCHLCFRNINVSYMGLRFENPYFKKGTIIQEGSELPNKGACKHMKYSFRWIRYGCCGRSFSCDDCHAEHSLHDKIEGITMTCGFCSIQQFIAKNCVHCGREVQRGVDKSGHWEGGLGCRDQALLSRKDAKKYTGLTKKKG